MKPATLLVPWGIAWLLGYATLFLRSGPDDRVLVEMPEWLPLAVLFSLLAAAAVITGTLGARAYRRLAGESAERGAMYGWAWTIAFAGFVVLAVHFDSLVVALGGGGGFLFAVAWRGQHHHRPTDRPLGDAAGVTG